MASVGCLPSSWKTLYYHGRPWSRIRSSCVMCRREQSKDLGGDSPCYGRFPQRAHPCGMISWRAPSGWLQGRRIPTVNFRGTAVRRQKADRRVQAPGDTQARRTARTTEGRRGCLFHCEGEDLMFVLGTDDSHSTAGVTFGGHHRTRNSFPRGSDGLFLCLLRAGDRAGRRGHQRLCPVARP